VCIPLLATPVRAESFGSRIEHGCRAWVDSPFRPQAGVDELARCIVEGDSGSAEARAAWEVARGGLALDLPVWAASDFERFALASPEAAGPETDEEKPGVGGFLLDSLVVYALMWGGSMAFSGNVRDGVLHSSWSDWVDNVSKAPNWNDGSSAVTNWVSHPLLGATNFLVYRSRGHGLVASSVGVVLQSALLEYTIEAAYNRPSLHDLVITPVIGIPVGYGLDTLSVYLLKKEEKPLRYLGYLFNPFNLLPTAKENRWQVAVDPVGRRFALSVRF
jgi:hypothetical protein